MPTLREQTEQYFGTALENWNKLQQLGSPDNQENREVQFDAQQPYNARQGEFRNAISFENLLQDALGGIANSLGQLFRAGDTNFIGSGLLKDRDRVEKNTRIKEENLNSRWNYSGAGLRLLGHSALKHNPNGQSFIGLGERQLDTSPNYTSAGALAPRILDNRDGYQEDYKLRYYTALGIGQGAGGSSDASPPDDLNIRKSAEAGFNAGQINPIHNNKVIWKTKFEDSTNLDAGDLDLADGFRVWLDGVLGAEGNTRLQNLNAELNTLKIETMTKVSEGSVGFARIPIPFLAPVNLTSLLQQNLIVPPDVHKLRNPSPPGQRPPVLSDDTFSQLYLQNKSVIDVRGTVRNSNGDIVRSDTPRNPKGTIAGVPIPDLEGAMLNKNGGTYSPNDNRKVFDFNDDKFKNNEFRKERGFTQNIAGNVQQGGLMPAVENINVSVINRNGGQEEDTLTDSLGRADTQQFPFMFETINKQGSSRPLRLQNPAYNPQDESSDEPEFLEEGGIEYKQYCYFQATLSNISETFSPTWSAKHFFGRSEQIHSYTMTDRAIELSFVIFASEIRRLQNVFERISWLAQQTYASYDANGRQKAGPIIRMTIGDMFAGLNGFIRSLSYDWNYLGPGGKWEITQGLRIPMACSVNMSFQVLHTKMPDRNYAFYQGPLRAFAGLDPYSPRGATGNAPFEEGGPLITVGPNGTANPDAVLESGNEQQMYISQLADSVLDEVQGSYGVN